jgi:hypothetical protein
MELLIRKLKKNSTNLEHVRLSRVMTFEIKVFKKLKYMMDFIIVYYAY